MFIGGMDDAGRWALLRRTEADGRVDAVEHAAMVGRRRYGVVFWRLLEREADWLPPWRDLLRVFHRLEARGEIRGGRFVAGLAGEQFALPEAVPLLREMRKRPLDGSFVAVSAVDPLNLVGTLLPGETRCRRCPGIACCFATACRSAAAIAAIRDLLEFDGAEREAVRLRLVKRSARGMAAALGAGLPTPFDAPDRIERCHPPQTLPLLRNQLLVERPRALCRHARNGNARIVEQPVSASGRTGAKPGMSTGPRPAS